MEEYVHDQNLKVVGNLAGFWQLCRLRILPLDFDLNRVSPATFLSCQWRILLEFVGSHRNFCSTSSLK
jgi:hypothetical protein